MTLGYRLRVVVRNETDANGMRWHVLDCGHRVRYLRHGQRRTRKCWHCGPPEKVKR